MSDRKVKTFDSIEYLNKPIDGYRWTGPIMDRPQYGNKETDKFAIELKPIGWDNHVYTKDEHDKLAKDQECMYSLCKELKSLSEIVKDSDKEDLTDAFLRVCKAYDHVVNTLPVYDGFITDGFEIKEKK